jgi:hypothetical protein
MVLDVVLLSIAKITAQMKADISVTILLEMRLTSGDGVRIASPNNDSQAYGGD